MSSTVPRLDARSLRPAGPTLPSPVDASARIKAVLFDLDGTLYRQFPVRGLMALELLTMPAHQPLLAPRRWRALRAYRRAQEQLRSADGRPSLSQTAIAAARTGLPVAEIEQLANEWMQKRPLKYLRRWRAPGLDALVSWLAGRGIPMGVLSDYPAAEKLAALGLGAVFSPVLWTGDPEIAAFKPHPRGFLRAAAIWHLPPAEVLVVGDRVDADAAGAAAAGMPCVLIGRSGNGRSTSAPRHRALPSLEALHHVLDSGR